MKYFKSLVFGLSVIFCCNSGFSNGLSGIIESTTEDLVTGDTLKIESSPELSKLITTLTREYEKFNPSVKFLSYNIIGNQIDKAGTISFISNDYSDILKDSPGWKISIGHDPVVPVFNVRNPMFDEISSQGISGSEFSKLVSGTGKLNWSDLISRGLNKTVNQYIIDYPGVKANLSAFTKKDPAALIDMQTLNREEFISNIQKDPYSIGFCKLSDVRKEGKNEMKEDIRLMPVDKNSNGRIDTFERIFNTPDELSRGVWIGKYPHELTGSIYAISQEKPTDKNTIEFLTWIMNNSGQYLASYGYSDLIGMEKQSNLAALMDNEVPEVMPAPAGNSTSSFSWLIILAMAITAGLIISIVAVIFKGRKSAKAEEVITITPLLNENMLLAPKGLYFDKTHTWSFMETDGIIRVGIDDFLQHLTGSITRIIMKDPGAVVRRGDRLMTIIHDGKQMNLYSPVSGTIKKQNSDLSGDPSKINSSPFTEGWVYMIEPKNWLREIQFMFMGEKYKEWLRDEFIRLRNFFEGSVRSNSTVYNYIVLQDGGELTDNVLADLGPEVWEEFQENFIDSSK